MVVPKILFEFEAISAMFVTKYRRIFCQHLNVIFKFNKTKKTHINSILNFEMEDLYLHAYKTHVQCALMKMSMYELLV